MTLTSLKKYVDEIYFHGNILVSFTSSMEVNQLYFVCTLMEAACADLIKHIISNFIYGTKFIPSTYMEEG